MVTADVIDPGVSTAADYSQHFWVSLLLLFFVITTHFIIIIIPQEKGGKTLKRGLKH